MKCTEYIGMTPREALEVFSDKYYRDGDSTENGVIARVISDYFDEVVSKEEHNRRMRDLEDQIDELQGKLDEISSII